MHGISFASLTDQQSNSLLHLAASRGCRNTAEMIVRAGLSPNDVNSRAESALKIAEDFKGCGKPYKSTYQFIKLVSSANATTLEATLQQLSSSEDPPQLKPALLQMVGLRVLSDFHGVGPVEGVSPHRQNSNPISSLTSLASDSFSSE